MATSSTLVLQDKTKMLSPFTPSTSKPGNGEIHLALFPPSTPVLKTLSYQYPLKLIAPSAVNSPDGTIIHTVFILTYGGGLVAGDTIDLRVQLDISTRLVLLTQGSTKIFKTPDPQLVSAQRTHTRLEPGSALCYLPEPVQPFAASSFEQIQTYELPEVGAVEASLCVCDWVSAGRAARGENWDFYRYTSRNEVWIRSPKNTSEPTAARRQLVLRDNVVLDAGQKHASKLLKDNVDNQGVFGTLILRGPLFADLAKFFMAEFMAQPRVGARTWGDEVQGQITDIEEWRKRRLAIENRDGLLWTAAQIRGCVVVKFSSKEVEGGKRWLLDMLRRETSVEEHFGEKALLCLR